MFTKGSRYRDLPESAVLDAEGEWRLGKNLRFIPDTPGRLLHTVLEGDRLDLLAFKYYNDTTRWWQISDANPEFPFPVDLLDRRPFVEEVFALEHEGFAKRYLQLVAALQSTATVRPFEHDFFGKTVTGDPNFSATTLTAVYAPAPGARAAILAQFAAHGFHLLDSHAWPSGPDVAEAFTFEDPEAKRQWRAFYEALGAAAGVVAVQSDAAGKSLRVLYNGAVLQREALVNLMRQSGFAVTSAALSRVGDRAVVPPNQAI